jgi:Tfp pilus assembly protein PilN
VIRINLIPPEIIEKRKDEQRWRWVLVAGMVALVMVVAFYLVMFVQVSAKQSDVAGLKQEAQSREAEASRFRIFQQKESDLTSRRSVVLSAKAGRIDWARMFNEISMVLPTDMYLIALSGNEPVVGDAQSGTILMSGKAVDYPEDSPDNGYKSVAKALVRFTELTQLESVWLTSTDRSTQAAATAGGGAATQPMINWALTARITVEATTAPSAQ